MFTLAEELQDVEPGLAQVLQTIALCVSEIQEVLRQQEASGLELSGSTNSFGDAQLQMDMACDDLIFQHLSACPACCAASSEERPEMRDLPGSGYTVVFDPLDGSSIVGANFAVGSIFGVYPGKGVDGRQGREQAAACYAVYGPRTLLVWARPVAGPGSQMVVQQLALLPSGKWQLLPQRRKLPSTPAAPREPSSSGASQAAAGHPASSGGSWIQPGKLLFAPANLRCCVDNRAYAALVDAWISRAFTLRYTGGMVPDVHHIIAKGGGVFVSPASAAAGPKLRLVYECAPLALIVEAAGGASHDGMGSVLDARITSTQQRSPIVLGAADLVRESLPAMQSTA